MISRIFDEALLQNVKRFRLTSISKSLSFYLGLGFVYWGVNSVGDYYCNLPMPKSGLKGLAFMTKDHDLNVLLGNEKVMILAKIKTYELTLS